jgi:F0F1-type ATP synthase membrane subunit c/vacuolar-type H+-ATPase subunit K
MLPLELMSELSRTFALSVRLFGNMLSGYLIVVLVVALVGLFVPMPLMALDLLIGLLQAYIFAVLSTVYIGAAITRNLFVTLAMVESTAIFCLVIALILLFANPDTAGLHVQ